MLQNNQRAAEVQAKMMKSNSNSLLPGLPPRILSFNNSLNLTPDTASHVKGDQSLQVARKKVAAFVKDDQVNQ